MKGNALFHFIGCITGLSQSHSQTTTAEKERIAKYAFDASLAVEIGVYEGANTVNIAKHIKADGKLIGIDPFFKGSLGICYHEKIARNLLKRSGVENRVSLIAKFSADAATDVPDYVDYIFIDGDHSYEGFESDWVLFSKKVRAGGYILLHDTAVPPHDSSVASLGSFKYFQANIKNAPGFKLVETVDSLNVLIKL